MRIELTLFTEIRQKARAWLSMLFHDHEERYFAPFLRSLSFETLERRDVLTSLVVTNALDIVNGNTSSIANLLSNDGGDGVSLREAILATNNTSGSDAISFDVGGLFATPQEILLTSGQIAITEDLTITAPGAQLLTINAQLNSRIFFITSLTGDYTFRGLTLTNGRTTGGGEHGGAIRSDTSGDVLIQESSITGNGTTGNIANGGGIYTNGNLTLRHSAVTLNSTSGTQSLGGAIYILSDYLDLYDSTVSNNTTIGDDASGGAIAAPNSSATLTRSTISGNSTAGIGASGGGINAYYTTLIGSTVSGNHTTGNSAPGGGVFGYQVTLYNSTVSGNSTSGENSNGGGIAADDGGATTLAQSTVTSNQTTNVTSSGGGLFVANGNVTLTGSIVSANGAANGATDVLASGSSIQSNYSLIGTGISPLSGGNNVVTDSPQLGALINNGGSTETHALLGGSPAINAGDPSAVLGIGIYAFVYDQRGNDYGRLQGGRVDIGAFEVQDPSSADFDGDGLVTGRDFLFWQRGVGKPAPTATKLDGDADNDLDSDSSDLEIWELQYGGPALTAAVSSLTAPSQANEISDTSMFQTEITSLNLKQFDRASANDLSEPHQIRQIVLPVKPYTASLTESVTVSTNLRRPSLSDGSDSTYSIERSGRRFSTWIRELDEAFDSLESIAE